MLCSGEPEMKSVQATGRIRQFTTTIVLNIVIFVLILGGLEIFLRVRQQKIVGPRARVGRQLWDRFVGWRNNPEFSDDAIQHNAQGFRRAQDVTVDKSPGLVRVFFLGGSAAYGEVGAYPEIDNQFLKIYNTQLIDHYLETRLNTVFPSVRWEVINGAAVGYRLYQELTLIESVLLRYHP